MGVEPTKLVQKLEPYTPGEQPQEPGFIKLNTNESPYPPAPEVLQVLKSFDLERLRLYPDPLWTALRTLLAEKHRVSMDRIFIGNGSDEVLRLLFQAYLAPGDTVAITDPTYSLYPVLAHIFGAEVKMFPLDDQGNLPRFPDLSPYRLFALANPNPPLGTFYAPDQVERLVKGAPSTLFLIDEAYVDFADQDSVEIIRSCENAVISRSFSKSYSLAGIRVGYLMGPPGIIGNLYKIKDSYNVCSFSQLAACAAIKAEKYYQEKANLIKADREFLTNKLRHLGFKVYDSKGNFVFAECGDGKSLYEFLKSRKILVRYFDIPGLRRGVRITIGTHAEILELLKALEVFIPSSGEKARS